MRRVLLVAMLLVPPGRMAAQPPVGGMSLVPDGPGRYVLENKLGQRTGTLVETSPGVYRFRNSAGRLSDWRLRKRLDGVWDFVPSPFGESKKAR